MPEFAHDIQRPEVGGAFSGKEVVSPRRFEPILMTIDIPQDSAGTVEECLNAVRSKRSIGAPDAHALTANLIRQVEELRQAGMIKLGDSAQTWLHRWLGLAVLEAEMNVYNHDLLQLESQTITDYRDGNKEAGKLCAAAVAAASGKHGYVEVAIEQRPEGYMLLLARSNATYRHEDCARHWQAAHREPTLEELQLPFGRGTSLIAHLFSDVCWQPERITYSVTFREIARRANEAAN